MQPLTGEPLALDLLNTVVSTAEGETDHLERVADFEAWLALEADRLVAPKQVAVAQLAGVRELREQIRVAVASARQNRPIPGGAVRAIDRAVRGAPAFRVLRSDRTVHTQRDGDDAAQLLAQLAEAAVDLLGDPAVSKVRACEGPHCRMLFLPAHPRRRWCSPAICGNRVRVARYHQRHKDA